MPRPKHESNELHQARKKFPSTAAWGLQQPASEASLSSHESLLETEFVGSPLELAVRLMKDVAAKG